MRLVIDARMLDHSGIGVYLSRVLPRVLPRCASVAPIVLTLPALVPRMRVLAGAAADVRPWASAPLTASELRPAPIRGADLLWWTPHFNVPVFSRVPLVVTLHDLLPLGWAQARAPRAARSAVRACMAAIRRRARHVICVSEFTLQQAVLLGGLDRARMSVIALGADVAPATALPPRSAGGPPYLLFVGMVKPHKNLAGLLRAFEQIAPRIAHRLVVVGRHSGLRGIDTEALALARRLAPRVELMEGIPAGNLADLMAGADLLIQPSFHEGFGLPPLEAMAAGTPVLAARAGALPEVCGDAALYFDPASPADIAQRILQALGDDALRARMREAGLARARRFPWDACAGATADVLLAAAHDAAGGVTP